MTGDPGPDALVVGCGDIGTEVGLRLARHGARVLGLRRRAELVPAPLAGLSVDLTREAPVLPPGEYRLVAIVLTPDGRDEAAYRRTYLDGMARALDGLEASGARPERAVLVSSSGVWGEPDDPAGEGVRVDESTPAGPSRPTGRVLLEAERRFRERIPHGTVVRLAGVYGPGRGSFVEKVRAGRTGDPRRWTNRIHRDDAAEAVAHLLTRAQAPAALYAGCDDEPARVGDVAAFVARELGLPRPGEGGEDGPTMRGGTKRLDNALLRGSGVRLAYPTYREGYAAILAGEGRRHP